MQALTSSLNYSINVFTWMLQTGQFKNKTCFLNIQSTVFTNTINSWNKDLRDGTTRPQRRTYRHCSKHKFLSLLILNPLTVWRVLFCWLSLRQHHGPSFSKTTKTTTLKLNYIMSLSVSQGNDILKNWFSAESQRQQQYTRIIYLTHSSHWKEIQPRNPLIVCSPRKKQSMSTRNRNV